MDSGIYILHAKSVLSVFWACGRSDLMKSDESSMLKPKLVEYWLNTFDSII